MLTIYMYESENGKLNGGYLSISKSGVTGISGLEDPVEGLNEACENVYDCTDTHNSYCINGLTTLPEACKPTKNDGMCWIVKDANARCHIAVNNERIK